MRVGSGRPLIRAGAVLALSALAVLPPAPVEAQVPPDSLGAPLPAGTGAAQIPDSAAAAQDTVSADTIFYNLPQLESGVPVGFATGVWHWDREAIFASGANTLAELVADVPGLITLLGGDYGTPAGISAFGTGGGGVRVVRDGFEVLPLEGGVTDLQRIALTGITDVRLERAGGELLIELTSFRYEDGRPFSLVEAGTGQLNTNLFRGTFADPTSLRGSIALGLERVDTRGYGDDEGGNRTGSWFRYQLHHGDRAGLALEYRRAESGTQVTDYQSSGRRTDVTVRGRIELADGVVAEAYTGRSTHTVNDPRTQYEYEGGRRGQHGVRLALRRDGWWARGAYRLYGGDDLPSHRADGTGGYDGDRFGLTARVSESSWQGRSISSHGLSGWLGPVAGASLFGSWESGTWASRTGPLVDIPVILPPALPGPAPVTYTTSDRTLLRVGASASLLGVRAAVAGMRLDADQYLPLSLELDRGAPVVPGGAARTGVEAWGSLPTPWRSVQLEGSYQQWDRSGPYLPRRIYRGAFVFHKVYLESRNFEMWWSVGVRGHDPMDVFVADDGMGTPGGLARVPFYQDWYGKIQVRIIEVRLFFGWDNLAIRRNLQNFPGRLLPPTRSFFALRWDMWS